MAKVKAVIFDMDGTVADTLASIAGFGNAALKAHGYPALDVELYRQLVGNGADVLMRRMLTAAGADYTEDTVKALRKTYDALYEEYVRLYDYFGRGENDVMKRLRRL